MEPVLFEPGQVTLLYDEDDLIEDAPSDEEQLDHAENRLAAAMSEADRSNWHAIFTLYHIYKTGIWKHGNDEDGEKFTNFEDYIASLRGKIPRLGIRWAQDMIASLTLCLEGLGITAQELIECSPSALRDIKQTVDWDQKSKTIKGYNVPGGKEEVLQLLKDAGAPGTRPSDVKGRVHKALNKSDTTYKIEVDANGGVWLTAYYNGLAYLHHVIPHYMPKADALIINDLKRRLKCP